MGRYGSEADLGIHLLAGFLPLEGEGIVIGQVLPFLHFVLEGGSLFGGEGFQVPDVPAFFVLLHFQADAGVLLDLSGVGFKDHPLPGEAFTDVIFRIAAGQKEVHVFLKVVRGNEGPLIRVAEVELQVVVFRKVNIVAVWIHFQGGCGTHGQQKQQCAKDQQMFFHGETPPVRV